MIVWETQADFVCKYFQKGDPILIAGSLQSRPYELQNGEKRTAYEIVAGNVSFAGEKNTETNSSYGTDNPIAAPQQETSAGRYSAENFEAVAGEDDIPF